MKYTIVLLGLLLSVGMTAQNGIQFEEGTWQEALDKAKAQNKVVFVDAYTTWCGPCKSMAKNVFPRKAVGNLYNAQFVNKKIDMEKGEGLEIARKYAVRAYPTYLFIDGDGTLVHRSVGYQEIADFLELGRVASDPSRRMSSLDSRYEKGERNPAFLYEYAVQKGKSMDPIASKVANEYLATQQDWGTPENMTLIFQFVEDTDSKMFDYLVENKSAFIDIFGDATVLGRIQNLIYASMYKVDGEDTLAKVERMYKKVYPDKAAELVAFFKTGYYRQANDIPKYIQAVKDYTNTYAKNDSEALNDMAWNFYEMVEDPKELKYGVKIAKRSVKLEKNYYNMDTLAALYYKLGKKGKARKMAQKAIELAKAFNQDYSTTEQLLKMIERL